MRTRRKRAAFWCPCILQELIELFAVRGCLALLLLVLLSRPALAADPGHDSLYVEETGDSELTGSLNISNQLKIANLLYSSFLHIQGNATLPATAATKPNMYAIDNSYLYLNAPTAIYLAKDAGSTVYVGGSNVNLNVSGAIYQQNVLVCLANGTNCISGNNSGNISTISSANNGIAVANANGPTTTLTLNATTCGANEFSYWTGTYWACGADDNDGSGGYQSNAGGWTNTSTKTSTSLNVNVTTGDLTVVAGSVGIGTSSPAKKLDVNNGSQGITFDPTVVSPTITTTAGNLTIDSASGYVIINIG